MHEDERPLSSHPSQFKNTLLQHLRPDTIERLQLRRVTLELGKGIEFPGKPIDHLSFIEKGIGAMTTTFKDGSQVEVSMFGYESVIGVSALMGTKQSLNRAYMQLAGYGWISPMEAAKREFERCADFHHLALRYVQAQLIQAMQSAGCNVKHDISQRLARRLLLCADHAHTNTFSMSQEFMAEMLGSSRSTVSIAAGMLKQEGLIDYSRGAIEILRPAELEQRSCECYRIVKDHLDNYAEFDTGYTA